MAPRTQAPRTEGAHQGGLRHRARGGGGRRGGGGGARGVWFGTPAAKVEGKIFMCLWRGAFVARLGAEEVDQRVLAGDGVRFDPSGKGMAMKDWLESNAEPGEGTERGLRGIAV